MITTYLRSSSINAHEMCEQSYFLSYVLGLESNPNKKTEQGTICHKVFECLALESAAIGRGDTTYIDDNLGQFDVGTEPERLLNLAYDYYTEKSVNEFEETHREECLEWVKKALAYNDGEVDPRNRKIVAAETHFDFEIDRDWANYKFNYEGKELEGKLAIKGTIDLVTEVNENTLEVIDWKTGARKNWGTGEIKTYKKLQDDIQLRMYHYALSKLYPQYKTILVSIYFINPFYHRETKTNVPAGLFTIAFSKHDLKTFEDRLRVKFQQIRESQRPHLNTSWKCKSFCHFGKTKYPGSNLTICEYIRRKTESLGIESTVDNFKNPNHKIDKYKPPGD